MYCKCDKISRQTQNKAALINTFYKFSRRGQVDFATLALVGIKAAHGVGRWVLVCEPNIEFQPTGLSILRGGFGLRSSGERQNYVRIP